MALLGVLRGGRRLPLMKILMSVLAYRSITRGKGRIAALIGARMGVPVVSAAFLPAAPAARS